MATFVSWLPEVLPEVPGCPRPQVINAIRNASIEFCRNSLCWQNSDYVVTLQASDLPYDLYLDGDAVPPLPVDATISLVMACTVEGRPLTETNLDELKMRVLNWRNITADTPEAYFMVSPSVIDFYPRPPGTTTFDAYFQLALEPTRDADVIDDSIYDSYLEDIAAGALYRLLMLPGKPWTNLEMSRIYYAKFRAAMSNAAVEVNRSFTRGDLRIQMKVI